MWRSRLRTWSRETGSAVPYRVSLLISTLRLNLVLTQGIPLDFHDVNLVIYQVEKNRSVAYRARSGRLALRGGGGGMESGGGVEDRGVPWVQTAGEVGGGLWPRGEKMEENEARHRQEKSSSNTEA